MPWWCNDKLGCCTSAEPFHILDRATLEGLWTRRRHEGLWNSAMMDLLLTIEELYDQFWSLLGARGSQWCSRIEKLVSSSSLLSYYWYACAWDLQKVDWLNQTDTRCAPNVPGNLVRCTSSTITSSSVVEGNCGCIEKLGKAWSLHPIFVQRVQVRSKTQQMGSLRKLISKTWICTCARRFTLARYHDV